MRLNAVKRVMRASRVALCAPVRFDETTMKKLTNIAGLAFIAIALVPNDVPAKEAAPDFNSQIAPLLTKYCGGCHNEEEANGDLSLASFAALQNGGESGPAFTPGSAASSRMIQMLAGKLEPKMPPEDEHLDHAT